MAKILYALNRYDYTKLAITGYAASYTVKTIPPLIYCKISTCVVASCRWLAQLTINRANRGVVPFQKRVTPSSEKMRYAQCAELRYWDRASRDCILVLITLEMRLSVTRPEPFTKPRLTPEA